MFFVIETFDTLLTPVAGKAANELHLFANFSHENPLM